MSSTFTEVMEQTVELSEVSRQRPVTQKQLRQWIYAEKLPAWKVGGRLRIRLSDLDQLVEQVS